MKYALIGIAVIGLGAWASTSLTKGNNKKTAAVNEASDKISNMPAVTFEPVAVIELFTSQGCSSCPSADKLMAKTIEQAGDQKIYALSFHVDYWNRLGWADPFSSAAFSQRQSAYVAALNASGAYTPQMVLNGSAEFVGSDEAALRRNLKKALATKASVGFTKLDVLESGGGLKVDYALVGNYTGKTINIALVSVSETTVVKRGENGGRTLKNDNVVRQFTSNKAAASGSIICSTSPMPAKGNISVIAYVQEPNAGVVLGAAAAKY